MTPTLCDSEVIPHAPIIQCVRAFECLCASKWVFCVFPCPDHEILNECKLLLVLKTSLNYIKLQDAHTDTHTLVNSTWLAQVVSILANIIRFWLILSVSFPSTSSCFLCPLLPLYLSPFYFMPIVSRSVFPWSLFWFPLYVTFFLLPLICFPYHKQNINTLSSLSLSLMHTLALHSLRFLICFSEYGPFSPAAPEEKAIYGTNAVRSHQSGGQGKPAPEMPQIA